MRSAVGIVAPVVDDRAIGRIAQERDAGVVELDVGRARRGERRDLLAIGLHHVVPELIEVTVVALAHALVAAREHVQHDGRRHRHLRHAPGVRLEKREGAHDRAVAPADRCVDPQPRERLLGAALVPPGHLGGAGAVGREAPVHHQLEPPAAAAEFAVGDGAQPDALLHRDHVADARVLDGAQFGIVVGTEILVSGLRSEQPLARVLELLRAQQAADLVGAERRARARDRFRCRCGCHARSSRWIQAIRRKCSLQDRSKKARRRLGAVTRPARWRWGRRAAARRSYSRRSPSGRRARPASR